MNLVYVKNLKNEYHVYLTGNIGKDLDGVLLASEIKSLSDAGIKKLYIHINSFGGSVKQAYDIISAFKNSPMEVIGINEGFAVSSAAFILAACDKRKAYDYSMAMIHNPIMKGQSLNDMEEGSPKEFNKKVRDGILTILNFRLNKSEKEIMKLMDEETSFNSNEQKEIGLVDEIINTESKPNISNELSMEEKFEIVNEFNQQKIDFENMKDVLNHLGLEESDTSEKVISKFDELKNESVEKDATIQDLKIDNYILSNSITDAGKIDKIKKAVEKHGLDVLNTLSDFITSEPTNVEPVVEEGKVDKAVTEPTNVVEDTVDPQEMAKNALKDVNNTSEEIINSGAPDYEKMANEIFDIDADPAKSMELKMNNPDLHEKLKNIWLGTEE